MILWIDAQLSPALASWIEENFGVTARPIRDLVANDESGVGFKQAAAAQMSEEDLDRELPKFRSPESIHITVAGSEADTWP